MKKIRITIWGFGAMGSGMAKMLLKKKGVEIVGVCDKHPQRIGKSIFSILGIQPKEHPDVIIHENIEEVITEGCADVVLIATDSFTKNAFPKIKHCLANKINVISTAEEMSYPKAQSPELALELDEIAKENGVTVLGTGINPGLIMDLLVVLLTGACEDIDSISAKRVNDLSPFGSAVMEEQGVGLTKEEFDKGIENNTLAGHVGFPESINMISDAIGWKVDKIEQNKEPIISNVYRETDYAQVQQGNVAGCAQKGYGYVKNNIKIDMNHPQQILPHLEGVETGDYIAINGSPNIEMQIKPEIPGGIGTIAMCVNMIPHVINSHPGLVTMLDLPVPRAILGDMRELIK